ncbi:hypothetical protein NL108_016801 [Boleophthalmus pectinirostris]|nr:hypothetical protein NL108_016801 [Boleophthalmus pectinirostris]
MLVVSPFDPAPPVVASDFPPRLFGFVSGMWEWAEVDQPHAQFVFFLSSPTLFPSPPQPTDVKCDETILQLLRNYHLNHCGKSLARVCVRGVTTNRDDRKAGSS